MNLFVKQGVKPPGDEGSQMNTGRTDLTVFARDYPEARLVLEVKLAVSSPPQEDPAIKQVASYMWGANCHYGIIKTPTTTFILRDDFTTPGPESIRLTDELPTAKLLGRVSRPMGEALSRPELERLRASGLSVWRHLTKTHCPRIRRWCAPSSRISSAPWQRGESSMRWWPRDDPAAREE